MDDFDFDRAASAFPDISLDGEGDVPSFPAVPTAAPLTAFSFDDFGSPPRETFNEVKVTGDDEIEKFEDQFPALDVGHVRLFVLVAHCGRGFRCYFGANSTTFSQAVSPPPPAQPTFGAAPPFAPRPQPSAFSSTPILNQQIPEDEPEVIRYAWRCTRPSTFCV